MTNDLQNKKHNENELSLKWIDGTEITSEAQLSQWSSEDRALLDRQTLKSLFYSEDWVYIVVDAIAQPLSRVPWLVYRKVLSNGKVTYLPDEGHPLNKLLENPSPTMDSATFKYMVFSEDSLMGNALIWYARTTNEMHVIPTEIADYNFDYKLGIPTHLRVNPSTQQLNQMTLPVADIIHLQRPHVSNKFWGLSPFLPTRKSILFQKYSTDFLNAFYQRGATPQAILEMDKEANEQNAVRLLKKFETAYEGRKNMRRTMLLPKGVKYSTTDTRIADQQIVELINMNRENILNALHIPKHVVSLNEAGSLGSEEFKQALKYFWNSTLIPITERLAGKMTRFFASQLGPDRVIGFNFDDVEVLQDDKLKKSQLATAMLTTMTINEVRETIWQLPAVADGDVIVSLKPVPPPQFGNQLAMMPTEQKPADKPSVMPVAEQQLEPVIKNANWFKKREFAVKMTHAIVEAESNSKSKSFESKAAELLDVQIDAVQKAIKKALKKKALEFDEASFSKEYDKLVKGAEPKQAQSYQEILQNTMELGYRSQLAVVFNKQDKLAIEALRVEGANGRRSILTDRGLELFKSTSQVTKEQGVKKANQILDSISSGMEQIKTVDQIASDIKDHLASNATNRAKTIARTEVAVSVSLGQQAMHADAKEVIPNLKKIWLNAGDNKVRGNPGGEYPNAKSDHWNVHGETVDIDKEYSNGLRYPHDTKGKAEAVINCRCTQLVVAAEDLDALDVPGRNETPNG
jgi:HK97 family phage portal protein